MATSIIVGDSNALKSVATPRDEYLSTRQEWIRNRAVIQGQSFVKDFDNTPNVTQNLLLPFNNSMTKEQFDHYKAEAELPGVSSQYAKMLTGGLLRKLPIIEINTDELNDEQKEEAKNWLLNRFGQANESMISFLDSALWEEMQTSRAWVQIDYPNVDLNNLSPELRREVNPFPKLWTGESIINWTTSINPITGESRLSTLIVRSYAPRPGINQYHPDLVDTVWVHYLDNNGEYGIQTFTQTEGNTSGFGKSPVYVDGQVLQNYTNTPETWTLINTNTNILNNGERLTHIPFYPLNGSIDIVDPAFTPIVDRELALYNKISRRNHLLYLSATYTPVVQSDTLNEADKTEIARQGLGTWMFVGKEDSITTLATPTHSLTDMEVAIKAGYEELTRIGVKMLSLEPANSESSGVALQIRNAAQNAQIATLNAKISESMRTIIRVMLNWKYNLQLTDSDIRYTLSSDFNKLTTSTETIRLISEWYQSGIIPRSLFVEIMKNNDILPTDYTDVEAVNEINDDDLIMSPKAQMVSEQESITQTNQNITPVETTEENN